MSAIPLGRPRFPWRNPGPVERCAHIGGDGRQCRAFRSRKSDSCVAHQSKDAVDAYEKLLSAQLYLSRRYYDGHDWTSEGDRRAYEFLAVMVRQRRHA